MLQWMGGSMRKVTTSRKSTQKRQKQYFEQRKRQQQQQAIRAESNADGVDLCGLHHKGHQSLDVINLLNFSTTAQEFKSTCPSGGRDDLDGNATNLKYHITRAPTFLNRTVTAADSAEIKEARSPSCNQVKTVSPNKDSFIASESYYSGLNGTDNKANLQKMATEQPEWEQTELSVFYLLGDDGPADNSEQSPLTEAHVAFSVEGLGRMGTRTPPYSPQQPGRIFLQEGSLPRKAAGRVNSLKKLNHVLDDLELEVDQLMQDINMPLNGSYLDLSNGTLDSYLKRNHKSSTVREHSEYDLHGRNLTSSFCEEEKFFGTGNCDEDIWDARSQFLDDNYHDEREGDISWKNWPSEMNGNSAVSLRYGDNEISDYAFEGPNLLKKRDYARASEIFNFLESPASECQKSGKNHHCMTSSGARHPTACWNFDLTASEYQKSGKNHHCMTSRGASGKHPTADWNFDLTDVSRQPGWSCSVNVEARDNLSLLSEESCSSSAVRGEATNNSPLKSIARQGRRTQGNAFNSPVNKYGMKDFPKESQYKDRKDIQQGNNADVSGKCATKISQMSKTDCDINSQFQEKLGSPRSWLFEDGFPSVEHSAATRFPFSGSELWTEDPCNVFPASELHLNDKSSLHGYNKHGESVDCSPFGGFIQEKFSPGLRLSHIKRHDSPSLAKVGFGPTNPDSSTDTGLEGMPPDSSHVAGPHGETPFADLSVQGSVSIDEVNKAKIETVNCEFGRENCIENNELLSEKEDTRDTSDSYENTSVCKEAKETTFELRKTLESTVFLEHAEDTSSFMKIPAKLKSIEDDIQYGHNVEILDTCRIGAEGKEDAEPQELNVASKRLSKCLDSAQPVMMLESYVLKLLCVQKVPGDTKKNV